MKALQFQAIGKLALIDIDPPRPAAGQLLVKTAAGVICTSDLNDLRGNPFHIELPVILGHEGSGTVAAIGEGVKGFAVGDRIATHPVHPCFTCENCKTGMSHLCANMQHFGLNMQGTFAEYYLVRSDRARKIAPTVDLVSAALAEPVCVCLEAIAQARIHDKSRLLILGDGPFGIMMALLARAMNIGEVLLAGEHDFRLHFARGCETLNLAKSPDRFTALKQKARHGFDAVILAVASVDAARHGLELLRPKGRLIIFSAFHEPVALDLFTVHMKELEIIGACNDQDRFDEAVRFLSQPEIPLGNLITHRFKLEQYDEALAIAANARDQALKVAFVF